MSLAAPAAGKTRWSKKWLAVAIVLGLVAAVCLAEGLTGHQHPLGSPVTHHRVPSTVPAKDAPTKGGAAKVASAVPAVPVVPVVARSVPVSLSIPAIGVSVSLSVLGLNPTGTVQVPTDYQQPGWYHLGPSPGQMGSAVILGHVDTYMGPTVFFRLRTLVAGDKIAVTLADGVVANFKVNAVALYPKAQFPAQQVYGSRGVSALQLVTCGGTFDTTTHQYLSNVVVYTTLVTTAPAPAPTANSTTTPAPTPLTGVAPAPPGTAAS